MRSAERVRFDEEPRGPPGETNDEGPNEVGSEVLSVEGVPVPASGLAGDGPAVLAAVSVASRRGLRVVELVEVDVAVLPEAVPAIEPSPGLPLIEVGVGPGPPLVLGRGDPRGEGECDMTLEEEKEGRVWLVK